MKSFKQFLQFLTEMAIPLSMYKDLMKNLPFKWEPRQEYFEIFSKFNTGPRKNKKPYRIYFPNIKLDINRIKVDDRDVERLNDFFEYMYMNDYLKKKFVVEDFLTGMAVEVNDNRRLFKIGKIFSMAEDSFKKNKLFKKEYEKFMNELRKYDKHDRYEREKRKELWKKFRNEWEDYDYLLKMEEFFQNHPARRLIKETDYTIVISHHPYDIAGMSTNRGWTSCMDMYDTEHNLWFDGLSSGIGSGIIIAYAVRNDDLNIQKPICRVLIKPYFKYKSLIEDNADFILVPAEQVYGTEIPNFREVVKNWCDYVNNKILGFNSDVICIYKTSGDVLYDLDDEEFLYFKNKNPEIYKELLSKLNVNGLISLLDFMEVDKKLIDENYIKRLWELNENDMEYYFEKVKDALDFSSFKEIYKDFIEYGIANNKKISSKKIVKIFTLFVFSTGGSNIIHEVIADFLIKFVENCYVGKNPFDKEIFDFVKSKIDLKYVYIDSKLLNLFDVDGEYLFESLRNNNYFIDLFYEVEKFIDYKILNKLMEKNYFIDIVKIYKIWGKEKLFSIFSDFAKYGKLFVLQENVKGYDNDFEFNLFLEYIEKIDESVLRKQEISEDVLYTLVYQVLKHKKYINALRKLYNVYKEMINEFEDDVLDQVHKLIGE